MSDVLGPLNPLPQCQAVTIEGYQCVRNAVPGTNYCWQHQNFEQREQKAISIGERHGAVAGPYVDVNAFNTYFKDDAKGRLGEQFVHKVVARGPLTIHIESTEYFRLPFDLVLGKGDYTYFDLINLISQTLINNLTPELFDSLIRKEENIESYSGYQAGTADLAEEFYKDLEQAGTDVYLIGHGMTGPDQKGQYYFRLKRLWS